MSAPGARALINPTRLDELRALLDAVQVSQLFHAFVGELASRPAHIADHVARADHAGARAAAHLFKGAALSVGADRIAWLSNALEHADDAEMPALVPDLFATATDTMGIVRRLAS